MKKYNKKIISCLLVIVICATLINCSTYSNLNKEINRENLFSLNNVQNNYVYLSDLDYIDSNNWSYSGWKTIQKDKNSEGGTISLIVNGSKKIFIKGMGVHADGQITYDISKYQENYSRFIATVGVDASRGTNGSVWFRISVSNDGTNWDELLKTSTLTGNSEAASVDVNISGYKYLRIYVDKSINANTADHGVIAGAKLVPNDYVESNTEYNKIHKLEYYDNILNQKEIEYNIQNNYRLILEREFVRKIGYDEIQALTEVEAKYKTTIDWILSDNKILEQVIEVGEVNGPSFIITLGNLLTNNSELLDTDDKNVYQKMMIGLAAAYSTDNVASAVSFGHHRADYDYLERFEIYKNLYSSFELGKYREHFKNYHVELMRTLMSDGARNDEIKWLNYYTKFKEYNSSVYAYVNHTGTFYGYSFEKLYSADYKEEYENKYKLSEFGVPFGDNIQRYWMAIETGGICWNQSRVFQSLFNSIGNPTIGAYQPGHEASFYYSPNNDGTGKWDIANNISGWGKTATSWYGGNTYRTIFNWGNKSFTDKIISDNSAGNNSGYIYLAQDNLNNYNKYKKSLYLNLLANSYSDNSKKIETYKKALEENDINLDSYDYIIQTYKNMDTISNNDWYQLASNIIDVYTYYPMGMVDLLKIIKPYLSVQQLIDIDKKENAALKLASKATENEISHPSASREIANEILGKTKLEIATFSFDGDNANKIVIGETYKNYDMAWHYSLDGGQTKSESITEKEYLLTKEEIDKITADNDILIYIDGLSLDTPSYTIDIIKGTLPTISGNDALYANDLENRVIGTNSVMEWRYNDSDNWTSYKTGLPDLTGNKTVQIRMSATGNAIASDYNTYTFTEDNQPINRKYIPISHLSIDSVSSEAVNNQGSASFAIDGNYNTRYHSNWSGKDTERYIVIKIDTPVYLSAIEYVPGGGGNGKIIDGLIEGSMDGTTWTKIGEKKGLTYSGDVNAYEHGFNNIKTFELDSNIQVQYVKITAVKATNGNWFNARMFNLFQDKNLNPTAGIVYSTKNTTNENVVATVTNFSSKNIQITSEGGNTHTFTENGSFEFTFIDTVTNKKGSAVAKVDWIDKIVPTAQIEYSTTSLTNGSVLATLKPSEDVTIINNSSSFSINEEGKVLDKQGNIIDGYSVDSKGNISDKNGNYITNINPFMYEFIQNGEFTFEFVDKAGNRGSSTAKVNWIDTEKPVASINYDIMQETNKDVTVTLMFNEENVKITNNEGKNYYTFTKNGEFTFEFVDKAGNTNEITAKVDWIDKTSPTATLKYDKSNKNKAIVSIINPSETIFFENGEHSFEFTENGIYEIVFYDKAGNKTTLIANIDWLKKDSNNNIIVDNSSKLNDKELDDVDNKEQTETDEEKESSDKNEKEENEINKDNLSNESEEISEQKEISNIVLPVIGGTITLSVIYLATKKSFWKLIKYKFFKKK